MRIPDTILDGLPDPVALFDRDWRIVYLNSHAGRYLGRDPASVYGRTLWEVWPAARTTLFGQNCQRAMTEGRAIHFDAETMNGRIFQFAAVPVEGGLLARGQDVTVREQARREHERRLGLILDRAGDAVLVVDATGRVLDANAEACRSMGYEREELLAVPLTGIAGRADPLAVLDRVAREGPVTFEGRHRRKDGTFIPVELRIALLEDGDPAQFVEIARDISERQQMHAALHRTERQYRRLVDVLPDAMLAQVDERIVLVNPAAVKQFGARDAADLIGRPMWDVLDPAERDATRERIRRMDETGVGVTGVPLRMRSLDGRVIQAEVSTAPVELDGRRGTYVVVRDRTEQLQAQERIALQARLLDTVGQAVMATDREYRFVFWNREAESLLGWTAQETLGRRPSELQLTTPEERARIAEIFQHLPWSGELELRRRDGRVVPVLAAMSTVTDAEGRRIGIIGAHTDLTQRRQLEDQLRQAQKMEAVGRLAGGVAHDFNNILIAIRGYTELTLEALSPDSPLRSDLVEVQRGAERAAEMTRQLLAFSRKQVLRPQVLDVALVVANIEKMMRRLIGEDVALLADCEPGTFIEADPGQLDQVLLNLAVNARDAMPEGGAIHITARSCRLPDDDPGTGRDLQPGSYVRLTFSDTGHGMDRDTCSRIFEPFFTTKPQGQGTGLGLSMVYGIVTQSGGHIGVSSSPGVGTRFEIYLPRVEPAEPALRAAAAAVRAPGQGSILLVEDEPAVRAFLRRVLERHGFRVLEAADGRHALQVAETADVVDLLLTDIVMPRMNGMQLAHVLAEKRPSLKVLYISGYSEDLLTRRPGEELHFLRKPFGRDELLQKVSELLGPPDAAQAAD